MVVWIKFVEFDQCMQKDIMIMFILLQIVQKQKSLHGVCYECGAAVGQAVHTRRDHTAAKRSKKVGHIG